MPATTTDHGRGLTKPKSKLRLRFGLTPPHPPTKTQIQTETKTKQPPLPVPVEPKQPLQPNPNHQQSQQQHQLQASTGTVLATSTSTTASSTGISRIDSRSAFTYDNYSPSAESIDGRNDRYQQFSQYDHEIRAPSPILAFETISLDDDELDTSMSTQMDPVLAQRYYPTPNASLADTEPELEHVEDDAGLQHPHVRAMVAASDDIFYLNDQQLGERFSFIEEIGFGNWGSVWKVRPRRYKASRYFGNRPGGKMGKNAAAGGGIGANGKVAVKLVHRQRTAVSALFDIGHHTGLMPTS